MDIKFIKRDVLKEKPQTLKLGVGKYFTDYMFLMDFDSQNGWNNARIVPYEDFSISPASAVLHYAQETFEGLKAYRTPEGEIQLFRPAMNARRFINSNKRMCLPIVPEDVFLEAVRKLVYLEKDWIPFIPNTTLYIRPFVFATDNTLGVHVSKTYRFCIILSPSGNYFPTGMKPISIYVEEELVRAVIGGTGFAKCGGNYAASLLGQSKAATQGYDQVLWLDGVEHKYIEEVGAMNIMFVINDEVVTPMLNGSILPGITRDSCITLLKNKNIKVSERRISIEEIMSAGRDGTLKEMFGTGTAAVILPVGKISYKGEEITINNQQIGPVAQDLFDELTGIQFGRKSDDNNWIISLNSNDKL